MLSFCNKVHITTVRVHQIAPLTHKCSHTNTSYPNDRVTGLWYCILQNSPSGIPGMFRPPLWCQVEVFAITMDLYLITRILMTWRECHGAGNIWPCMVYIWPWWFKPLFRFLDSGCQTTNFFQRQLASRLRWTHMIESPTIVQYSLVYSVRAV